MFSTIRSAASSQAVLLHALAASASMLSLSTAAAAEEVAAESGDIVVTAQKRSERLQDVPLAVTAVTGDSLSERGITETKDLTQISPSLTYQQGNNPSNSTFRIRGIGTSVFGLGNESSVSTVLDGVVFARQSQAFSDLADIEQVEILRGPQGTLFGKNATAGLINVITARPTKDLSGRFNATVAERGEYHLSGTVAGPVTDRVGARLTGFYNKDDGYLRNVATGNKANGYESWGVRGKVEVDLGALNLLGTASYSRNDAQCCQQVLVRSDNANLTKLAGPVVPGPNNSEVSSNLPTTSLTTQQVYSLEANYHLGSAVITAITAYQRYTFNNNVDVDAVYTPRPIFTGGGNNAAQFDVNGGPFSLGQFSQELRIASSGAKRLNYVVGGYYSNLNLDRSFTRRMVLCPTTNVANQGLAIGALCPAPVGLSGSHHAHLDNAHYAAFAQVDYRLIGGLKAIGGLRVQHETLAVEGYQDSTPPFVGDSLLNGFPQTRGRQATRDTAVTGKAGLQYEFSRNAQAYASYTRGYKGQGLGTEFTQTFNANPVVDPETVNAYEIGFKGSTADRTFSLSVALFLSDYRNLQVQANRSDPSTGNFNFVLTNAGKAQTKGFEIEATVRPDDHFSVGFSAAYTHARFDSNGIGCPLQNQAAAVTIAYNGVAPIKACFKSTSSTGVVSGANQNVRGGILPSTPEWRLTVNPRYEREIGNLVAYADVNLAYQSDANFSLEQDPLLEQDGYATVDARIGIRPVDKGLSASLWVKNLGNQRYYTSMGHASLLTTQTLTPGNLTAFLPKGAFRYFGATLGYSF